MCIRDSLQAALNPHGLALVRGARTFRVGDKVMQLRNDYDRNVDVYKRQGEDKFPSWRLRGLAASLF